jgi:hypothetical protein
MTDFEQSIVSGLQDAMKRLQADLRKELKAQGHYLTGKLNDSIEYDIRVEGDFVIAEMEIEDYGLSMEFGIKPQNIPYSPGSGAGTSKYIQGLISFWNKRGVAGREGVRAAFATAAKHKKEGMPTRSSFAFSTTGARTGFATTVLERDLELIGRILEEKTGATLEIRLVPELGKIEPIRISV